MKDEVLQKALSTDSKVIPRYDVVLPDGTKLAENAQLLLKNTVLTEGTPLNKQNLLSDDTSRLFGLDPATSTPDDVLRIIRDSIGYCPRVHVSFKAGGTLYLKNVGTGVEKSLTVPSEGYVVFDVDSFGTYKVWGVYQGTASVEETLVVDNIKMYNLNIAYYSSIWKFSVDSEVGATISVTHADGLVIKGTVGTDKTCSIVLPKTGKYTAVGLYDDCSSETYTLTVTDSNNASTYETSMKWITCIVNINTGSIVALTSGTTTRGGTATNGTIKVWLPRKDTWLVTCTLNNKASTENLVVDTYKAYTLNMRYYAVYGVRIPLSNSSPSALEYTDDAQYMDSGYASWSYSCDMIKNIKPCVLKDGVVQYYLNKEDLTKKEDGSTATLTSTSVGDVMVEIPKMGYRMYSDGTYQYVKITDQPNHPDYCYLAHSLTSVGDCDKIYIGAYISMYSNSKIYSISGIDPHKAYTITNARTYAQNRGTGYQLLSFYPWTLIQCLYTIIYKNLDSETSLGKGRIGNNNTPGKTGVSNTLGPCYGTQQTGDPLCFLNIEDPWGSLECFLDGIYVDANKKVYTSYKDFNDTGAGYPYVSDITGATGGFIKSIQGTNTLGFLAKEGNGSSTTYYCDNGTMNSDCIFIVGSSHRVSYDNRNYGIFSTRATYQAANSGFDTTGSRLMYKHKA